MILSDSTTTSVDSTFSTTTPNTENESPISYDASNNEMHEMCNFMSGNYSNIEHNNKKNLPPQILNNDYLTPSENVIDHIKNNYIGKYKKNLLL